MHYNTLAMRNRIFVSIVDTASHVIIVIKLYCMYLPVDYMIKTLHVGRNTY